MVVLILALSLYAGQLAAELSALYLSWYGDPSTTMTIQWHTPVDQTNDKIETQELLSGKWIKAEGSHLELGDRLVHKVALSNLLPDTEYSFRIEGQPGIY